jgi:hypothetical protein
MSFGVKNLLQIAKTLKKRETDHQIVVKMRIWEHEIILEFDIHLHVRHIRYVTIYYFILLQFSKVENVVHIQTLLNQLVELETMVGRVCSSIQVHFHLLSVNRILLRNSLFEVNNILSRSYSDSKESLWVLMQHNLDVLNL